MNGELSPKMYICLQEKNGTFEPIISQTLTIPGNIFLDASISGKVTKKNLKNFYKEVVDPVTTDGILIEDSFSCHKDNNLFIESISPGKQLLKKIIPPGITRFVQPLDVYFFRQYKLVIRRIYDFCRLNTGDLNIHCRNFIINIHSIVYNQFSSPAFIPMVKYAWYSSGFIEEKPVFKNASEVLFDIIDFNTKCNKLNCLQIPFMKCSFCEEIYCFNHFFIDKHTHF